MRNFVYNENNQLIAEYDNNNNVISEYYYFGLRPVAVKTNGTLHIVHTDYLGTPRVITSGINGGSIVWEWKNDNPYGNNKAEGSIEFNLRFAGQYYDYESDLHYNIYRTYNPETGRYLQSDPIGLAGGFNTYNYVNKNPLDAVDPDGLIPLAALVPGAIGGSFGAIANGLNYYSQGQSFWKGAGNGFVVGAASAYIPGALPSTMGIWGTVLGNAAGSAGTQMLNRFKDGVTIFNSGDGFLHTITDCGKEIALTGTIGGVIGGVFGSLAEGAKRISLNAIMAESGNKVETAIANTYGTAWTNIINVYANVAGLFTSGKK